MAGRANGEIAHPGFGDLRVPHLVTGLEPYDERIEGLPGVFFEGVFALNPPRIAHELAQPIPGVKQLYIPGDDGSPRYVLTRTGKGIQAEYEVRYSLAALPRGMIGEAEPLLTCGPYNAHGKIPSVELGGVLLWNAGIGGIDRDRIYTESMRSFTNPSTATRDYERIEALLERRKRLQSTMQFVAGTLFGSKQFSPAKAPRAKR